MELIRYDYNKPNIHIKMQNAPEKALQENIHVKEPVATPIVTQLNQNEKQKHKPEVSTSQCR